LPVVVEQEKEEQQLVMLTNIAVDQVMMEV
jgi:hypothetical protein